MTPEQECAMTIKRLRWVCAIMLAAAVAAFPAAPAATARSS
jgi:hypothetical protein